MHACVVGDVQMGFRIGFQEFSGVAIGHQQPGRRAREDTPSVDQLRYRVQVNLVASVVRLHLDKGTSIIVSDLGYDFFLCHKALLHLLPILHLVHQEDALDTGNLLKVDMTHHVTVGMLDVSREERAVRVTREHHAHRVRRSRSHNIDLNAVASALQDCVRLLVDTVICREHGAVPLERIVGNKKSHFIRVERRGGNHNVLLDDRDVHNALDRAVRVQVRLEFLNHAVRIFCAEVVIRDEQPVVLLERREGVPDHA